MLGRRIINTGSVSCTTDTAQILDPGTTESLALYRFEDNADDAASSTGKFGKGAKFPALASSYINTGFTSLGSNFSLSFWFFISCFLRFSCFSIFSIDLIGI